jgi:hypothetical protein
VDKTVDKESDLRFFRAPPKPLRTPALLLFAIATLFIRRFSP